MAYQVVKPLVITKKQDGSDLYLYQGAFLPDFASDKEVKRLLDEEFVEKVGADDVPGDGAATDGEKTPAKGSVKPPAKKQAPSAPSN